MLDPKILKNDLDKICENLRKKNFIFDKEKFLKIDCERRKIISETEDLKNKKNIMSKEIGILKAKGKESIKYISEIEKINNDLKYKQESLLMAEKIFNNFLYEIPNLLDNIVPAGNSDKDNKIIAYSNNKDFSSIYSEAINHEDIGKNLKMYDQECAVKISGSRFSLLYADLAKLHRSLGSFMLDTHVNDHNYTEVNIPVIVNADSLFGTGQLPKFKKDLFELKNKKNFFLTPTAEVPLTNILRDNILLESDLPKNYVALSLCFRSEAGSYGKDTKGLMRQHQFEKVELVKFVHPDTSSESLEVLIKNAEKILDLLELPYRKVLLCSGDTGFSSSVTYDLEVWMPSQKAYREISSCSNFKDFQARRLNIKYKNSISMKKEYVHTLNGSGLAIGRTLAAIIENYQNENGDIIIPKILIPYMGGQRKIFCK